MGKYWYQQYTNGSVLTRATQDINRYFPQRGFTASWVFVATWDYVQSGDINVFNLHSAPAITFQVVLISGGGFSFILMNYGDCAEISSPVEAGFDTINSTDYYLIHYASNGSYIPNLKNTTNVNVTGRWAFLVNRGSAPEIFYPFGLSGDTRNAAVDDGSSSVIPLLSPFLFFGRRYQQIYVNNNGHLTFNQSSSQFVPFSFPAYEGQDIIAGLWTNLDNRARGVVSYHQYTNGSVLTCATLDINNHFPNLTFNASWVFVATWDKVAYFPNTSTETSFQVVLISGSNFSFILMNYGDIAVTGHPVEAGYDTVNSFDYFVIPGSINGSFISNLKNSSNVNVPGRWAFRVDSGHSTSKKYVIGLRVRISSVFDLTQYENIAILQQIKQELVKYGLPRNIELKLRKVQKITP
ncbi:sushi, nidogen and EGF-like domain-containing protein 1 [Megalobrama amblycephala]|uniref:sushi, nidogen and EGF-like domain-containing protein 1 n=1 Tax=Megalobrama amblycephala TaxID=75352 RepID=UPI002013EB08|nr:sushi, nidogen and EGF-like domain-containing protein 1 [Megalobrama amblycephala]